jgi:hypothetical protein
MVQGAPYQPHGACPERSGVMRNPSEAGQDQPGTGEIRRGQPIPHAQGQRQRKEG